MPVLWTCAQNFLTSVHHEHQASSRAKQTPVRLPPTTLPLLDGADADSGNRRMAGPEPRWSPPRPRWSPAGPRWSPLIVARISLGLILLVLDLLIGHGMLVADCRWPALQPFACRLPSGSAALLCNMELLLSAADEQLGGGASQQAHVDV